MRCCEILGAWMSARSCTSRSYLRRSARRLLGTVRVPTLVIGGERDRLAPPEHCATIAAAMRDAELWIAPGCTHLALVEDPVAVNARIERFVERLTQAPF